MNLKLYQVSMEIAGNTALWTRPDSGDSPCSYPAPTYSAVRNSNGLKIVCLCRSAQVIRERNEYRLIFRKS